MHSASVTLLESIWFHAAPVNMFAQTHAFFNSICIKIYSEKYITIIKVKYRRYARTALIEL